MPFSPNAPAATITVNSVADVQANNNECTFREALINANANNQSGSTDCTAGSGADATSGFFNIFLNLNNPSNVIRTSHLVIDISGYFAP